MLREAYMHYATSTLFAKIASTKRVLFTHLNNKDKKVTTTTVYRPALHSKKVLLVSSNYLKSRSLTLFNTMT